MPEHLLERLAERLGRALEIPEEPAPAAAPSEPYRRLLTSGLVHAVCGRRDEAIRDLTAAARLRTDDISLYLVLGHLQRLKGQTERAVRLHQTLLMRADLDRQGRTAALVALALDYHGAGLRERALETVQQALRADPREPAALQLLVRLHEAVADWKAALQTEEKLLRAQPGRSRLPLAFLHYEIGCRLDEGSQTGRAARRLHRAIRIHPGVVPAYVRLGDLHQRGGRLDRALIYWERMLDRHPRFAHLVFARLESAYATLNLGNKLVEVCDRLAAADPKDWRSRLYLAEETARRGREDESARWALEALQAGPRALAAHRAFWRTAVPPGPFPLRALRDFLKATSGPGAGDDPHLCTSCRCRVSELLWRCPQCHAWASFNEDRG
jgi:lipopolysaccharide biosynthesis regulator YciM